jgi:hypothetical protein
LFFGAEIGTLAKELTGSLIGLGSLEHPVLIYGDHIANTANTLPEVNL